MTKSVSNATLSVLPSARQSPLAALVDDYLGEVRARGLSPKTIKYGIGWPLKEVFMPWCEANGITSIELLDNRVCNRFSAHLHEVGGKHGKLAPASIWTYSKSARRFLAWAKGDGQKVVGEVKLNKLPEQVHQIISRAEVTSLEDAAATERDRIVIRVLFETGMRREELVKLTTRDLFEQSGKCHLLVRGKGGRDREVPVSPALARRLRRYIAGRPKDASSAQIFLGLRRRPDGTIQPITPSGVTQMVSALGERVLGKQIHPHVLRHSMIAEMRRKRMDPILLAQLVGHSSMAMIQKVYNTMAPGDAHDALMQALRADD
jgi:integrase